ncbi:pyridoxal kinase [Ruegeria sp. 2205SS24-7]|uniref:pyridoxal kinase n=1 Tax=Ruegeria discodermiae TaxID=3064389 RepID=UPI002740BF14|nr:pyridoxal kinase [Ruegeria sp. 2205SS24-7]MDP5218808.1 pyridoxal kinase [Ruegeria sp. 2205SS24-7]
MSRILILSSYVTIGHVGLSAGQPVCQKLGINVTAVPTVVLSNHPGWPNVAQVPIEAEQILRMTEALCANGWLADHSAVLVGYMPSSRHVDAAVDLVNRAKAEASHLRVVIDPILGDHPNGLYVSAEVGTAVRDKLLPLADVTTPNLFELEWLSGRKCQSIDDAVKAAKTLGIDKIYVTSTPWGPNETGILSLDGPNVSHYQTRHFPDVPHGTGDVFAAMIAADLTVGQALGHVLALVRSSQGRPHLEIVEATENWLSAPEVAASKRE